MTERFLLADVGGTNTRLGLAGDGRLLPDSVRHYRNTEFSGLDAVLAAYLGAKTPGPIAALCAAVAGPVRDGRAQLTNHCWLIDAAALRAATGGARVHLVNDLQAQGYALDDLPPGAVRSLFAGAPAPTGAPRMVLNIGTGCNVAVVHRVAGGLFVPAAELGHSTLPHGSIAAGLYDHLRKTHPHLPVEAALSGPGLADIHRYLTGKDATPDRIVMAFAAGDTGARATLMTFSALLGQVAGNLALHHLPMGGICLSGGVARAVAPHLAELGFLRAFTDRGPYTDIVRAIPVSVVTEDDFALRGCARYLRQTLKA